MRRRYKAASGMLGQSPSQGGPLVRVDLVISCFNVESEELAASAYIEAVANGAVVERLTSFGDLSAGVASMRHSVTSTAGT